MNPMIPHRLTAATLLVLSSTTPGTALGQTPTVFLELSAKGLPSNEPVLLAGDYGQLSLTARISPPVGTAITLPNGTTGTIAGLGSIWFDLQTCSQPIPGTWTLSGAGFQGTAGTGTNWGIRPGWTTGSSAGTVQPDSSLLNIFAGQFVPPGQTANAGNPVVEIWRGKWVPGSFAIGRNTRFTVRPRDTSVYVRTGTHPNGDPIYTGLQTKSEPTTEDLFIDTGGPPPACTPFFFITPATIEAFPGDHVQFNVTVNPPGAGCPPWQFQWRRACTPLVDGGNITGAQSTTLHINPVRESDADFYFFSVSNWDWPGGALRLKVGCYANCDHSSAFPALTANDFQCFLNRYAAAEAYADCDGIGGLTANDFQCFLNKYASGCS